MAIRAALLLPCLALAACQGGNPYTPQSAPIPPAPPIERIQAPTYPSAVQDFSSYRSWSWRQLPAGNASLDGAVLAEMVADALDQQGLRPAPEGAKGDLQVHAHASTEIRVQHRYDDYGPRIGAGRYGGGYGGGFGMSGSVPVVRSQEQQVLVVRIEFYDSGAGRLVWGARGEAPSDSSLAGRDKAAREAVSRALADYPPR
jgi:hypothetical protein